MRQAEMRAGEYHSGMRTWYEIEESDAYLAARELLLRRCAS
jgi:hypothetical protein